MSIIKPEYAGSILGVDGRFHNVVEVDGVIRNQHFTAQRRKLRDSTDTIKAELRFDDECQNGHMSFAITATIYDKHGRDIAGGCCHDDICSAYPELSGLIKWHLCSTDGPMHYVANTLWHAGDRDCWGRRKGDVSRYSYGVRFGGSPVTHTVKKEFFNFLQRGVNDKYFEWVVEKCDYTGKSNYNFSPQYTFAGFGSKWHDCPFDNEAVANEWFEAMTECQVEFVKIPAKYSEGKERDFDAARRCAIWPDATDDELGSEKQVLESLLIARLPKLLEEFKSAMVDDCGFIWRD